jgi:lipoprotein-anchoring transpeptidase ErfK/SrfK
MKKTLLTAVCLLIGIFIIGCPCQSASKAKTPSAAVPDQDKDGLSDAMEWELGTDPNKSDTDGDGFTDGEEVASGYNPLVGNNDRSLKRWVVVDLSKQQLTYYMASTSVGVVPVSTGLPRMVTPAGTYNILRKVLIVDYVGPGYNLPNTKWNLEFKPHYYLHGAYWHNQFGIRPMSHGCVNIAYKNAEKLYKFLDVGDEVQVIGITPRGRVAKF